MSKSFLNKSEFATLSEKLTYYDVDQRGWEGESSGFEANAHHVLTHLVKDLANKDYCSAKVQEEELAPDALMYGIRLRRWVAIPTDEEFLDLGPENQAGSIVHRLGGELILSAAFTIEAAGVLSTHLHDIDHAKTHEEAKANRYKKIGRTADLLILSSQVAAFEHGFDIRQAFEDRLSVIRRRSNIPQPVGQ